ncbi:MAG: NAD-dependent epimerase/dehydratase family protein [Acidimicrobiales bacterium]
MGHVLIVGAGPIGWGTAVRLAEAGHEVIVATRSGGGPARPGVRRERADAADAGAMARLAAGADVVVNAANPPYTQWPRRWPPIAASLLAAARRSGAALLTMSNLYGHGPAHRTVRADTPLDSPGAKGRVRAGMWREAKAAHDAGRVRAAEVRSGNFFGPGVIDAHMGERVLTRVLAGKAVRVLGAADLAHSFSFVPDVTALVAALAAAPAGPAWGRPWLVPSTTTTQRELVHALGEAAGAGVVQVSTVPGPALAALGLVSPRLRELREVHHQLAAPFVIDAADTSAEFGLHPTGLDAACGETVAWWRARRRPTALTGR